MARYILVRLAEQYGVSIDFEPKPVKGDWNGSGCHMNFSTEKTRNDGGLQFILEECMKKLSAKHKEHIVLYGEGNASRLTGAHETSSIDKFDYGEGNRGASIRIPILTLEKKKGYFEDRRPASNIDPYMSTAALVDTCVLNSKYMNDLIQAYRNSQENNF
jgi:glutamine synthetase